MDTKSTNGEQARRELLAERFLGRARLERYLRELPDLDGALALHAWNERYAGALHVILGYAEIALRNAMDRALSALGAGQMGTAHWTGVDSYHYNGERAIPDSMRIPSAISPLIRQDVFRAHQHAREASLDRVAARQSPRTDRGYGHEDVLAQLMFGTWCRLVGRPVTSRETERTQRLWASVLHDAFPHVPADESGRIRIARKLAQLREIRNREAHHENLLYVDADGVIDAVMSLLAAIDPAYGRGWVNPDPVRQVAYDDPRRNEPIRTAAFKLTGVRLSAGRYTARQLLDALARQSLENSGRVLFCNSVRVRNQYFGRLRRIVLYADADHVAVGVIAAQGFAGADADPLRGIRGYRLPAQWVAGGYRPGSRWYAVNNLRMSAEPAESFRLLGKDKSLREAFESTRANFAYLR